MNVLISLILSFLFLFSVSFPIENIFAVPSISYNITFNYAGSNYTVFSDAGDSSGPKVYKFEDNFIPVLDGSENQVILLPTDPNYSSYLLNAFRVVARNSDSISAVTSQSFALLGLVEELQENSIAVWQINFGINELRSVYWTKLEKDEPFLNPNQGDVGYVFEEGENIVGGIWSYNFNENNYNWAGDILLSSDNAFRITFEQSKENGGGVAPKWELKNCKGDVVAEDKGDGNGPVFYKTDGNGNLILDENDFPIPITDADEIEKQIDDIAGWIQTSAGCGMGESWSGEASDENGNRVAVVVAIKKKNGKWSGFRIGKEGSATGYYETGDWGPIENDPVMDDYLQPGSILVMVEVERVGDEITYRVRHYIPKVGGGYNLDIVIYWFRGMFFWVPPWRP